MLSASQQKFVTSLHVKKYRQKYRKFIVEGDKLVAELLAQQRIGVSAVYGLDTWAETRAALLGPHQTKFVAVTMAELKKISALTTPNQVLAVADMPADSDAPSGAPAGKAFYLDGIQDPGNMGTILRIADWFGLRPVYCSPDSVDPYSPKVVQAGMGAVLRVPVIETTLEAVLDAAPGLPVLGADMDGADVFQAPLPRQGLLIIGNEGKGISAGAAARISARVSIPRPAGGAAESLNAAVAAGILAAVWVNAP